MLCLKHISVITIKLIYCITSLENSNVYAFQLTCSINKHRQMELNGCVNEEGRSLSENLEKSLGQLRKLVQHF